MAELEINIRAINEALDTSDKARSEIVRVLREIASTIEHRTSVGGVHVLRDVNGNQIGELYYDLSSSRE